MPNSVFLTLYIIEYTIKWRTIKWRTIKCNCERRSGHEETGASAERRRESAAARAEVLAALEARASGAVTESWPRAHSYYSINTGVQTVRPPAVPF